jgi:hypothetical protein
MKMRVLIRATVTCVVLAALSAAITSAVVGQRPRPRRGVAAPVVEVSTPANPGRAEVRHYFKVDHGASAEGAVVLTARWRPYQGPDFVHQPGAGTDTAELAVEVFAPDDTTFSEPLNWYVGDPVKLKPGLGWADVDVAIPMGPHARPYWVRAGVRDPDSGRWKTFRAFQF